MINLLDDLRKQCGLTLLFIAHDLSMVRYVSNRMAVMYLGSIVELGSADDVYFRPLHPYTKLLVQSNPEADPKVERTRTTVAGLLPKGEIPTPVNLKPGCRFAGRCPYAIDRCHRETPPLREISTGRSVACHLKGIAHLSATQREKAEVSH